MSEQLWWYTARSGGILAWVLLSAATLWGLALSTRIPGPRPRPNWMLDLHRFLAALAVVFTAVHVVALVADSYVHIGFTEILVPLTGDYRPGAVAWGVVGLYLLAAVEITSLLRRRISRRAWRWTHSLSFLLFGFATVHGLAAGTDAGNSALRIAMLVVTLGVIGLTVASVEHHLHKRGRHRTPIREGSRERADALMNSGV